MVKARAPTAVPIVELSGDNNGGYKLNEKELEKILLHKDYINKKVAVVSVAGAFRKGKSFLLNFFVHYLEWLESGGNGPWFNENMVLDKFQWKGGSERHTHGMLMWNKPYLLKDKNGDEIVVLLVDTQGTFDHRSTVQECATIFALSNLVSSIQIFNVSQQIQEDDLQHLRLFTAFAKLAQKNGNACPFQKLLFLVRDWPNSDEHAYGYNGGDAYLNQILETSDNQKPELQNVRKSLKNCFSKIEGFLMPHPGLRIAQNNSQKVLGKVEAEFEQQIKTFVPSVFAKRDIEGKKIAGSSITCKELYQLFKAYMKIFNSEDLPEPTSIFEATAKAALVAADEASRAEYERIMNELITSNPLLSDVSVLQDTHVFAKITALDIFDNKPKLGSEAMVTNYRDRLEEGIMIRFAELKRQVFERHRLEEFKEGLRKQEEEYRKKMEESTKALKEELRKQSEANDKRRREEEEQRRRDAEEIRREREDVKKKQQQLDDERRRLATEEKKRKMKEEEERRKNESKNEFFNVIGQIGAGLVLGFMRPGFGPAGRRGPF